MAHEQLTLRPRVRLFTTGGTIASAGTGGGRSLDGPALARLVPPDLAELDVVDLGNLPSRDITPAVMHHLAGLVDAAADGPDAVDGVVISHGTDTLEETAYALALLVPPRIPVVLTGAMRLPHHAGADGPGNLATAVAAAADKRLTAYGPVVAFADELHLARTVTKVHSTRLGAFASPAGGPVGAVTEGRPDLVTGLPTTSELLWVRTAPSARVELLWTTAGADGALVEAAASTADGLVVAAMGGGHVPTPMARALADVALSGIPTVLASRCVDGRILEQTYAGEGSETDLLARGLISAGDLSPLKARLRLLFGLSAGLEPHGLFPGAAPSATAQPRS